MMICIGGVCVPLNLLIPFLIGLLHRYGYLQWFKEEWVRLWWWKKQLAKLRGAGTDSSGSKHEAEQAAKSADRHLEEEQQQLDAAVDAAVPSQSQDQARQLSISGISRWPGGLQLDAQAQGKASVRRRSAASGKEGG